MLKFIQGKRQQPSADRQKLQKELFGYRKTVQHGFPNKPTCIAWDPELQLMAIGTATGAIKIVGKPGVEFYAHHPTCDHVVMNIIFIPNEGRLISLLDDNSLHLWEINDSTIEETKIHTLEGKLKKISAWCLESSKESLLLGTEGGNIYQLNVATFEVSNNIIYQDLVMQNVPEHYKLNPGAVEAISEQPGSPNHILIGYSKGLMVLWDREANSAKQTYISSQQIESLCWDGAGTKFISSHNDGSFAYWDTSKPLNISEPTTVYGPFPCKPIHKLLWRVAPQTPHDELLIFTGGMPRASYSDKYTVTVQQGSKKHVVFDFTSRVIDFFTIASTGVNKGVSTLVVLVEEEVVVIDLTDDDWSVIPLPYLVSLHASAVTFSTYVSDLPQELWNNLIEAGKTEKDTVAVISEIDWPINGGEINEGESGEDVERRDVLLTGHEDGSVRIWNAGGITLCPLLTFKSNVLLKGDDDYDEQSPSNEDQDEDEWPPFRKVGCFDPYSDDPRLAVKKISLCAITGTLVVAGTSGHVIVAKLNTKASTDVNVKVLTMNIVSDRDSFVWKGHEKLTVKNLKDKKSILNLQPGYHPSTLVQLHPPAAITALALHSDWGVAVVGTAHGLAVFDIIRNVPIAVKCTLNPNDLTSGDAPISRRKSFKKSLRESFRRLRKGRSVRHDNPNKKPTSPSNQPERRIPVDPTPEGAKPVERAIEARPVDDGLGSMVRCVYFAKSFIISVQHMCPTLWAGTNNGTVFVFTLNVPSSSKRNTDKVICQLAKEIQLKHRAPVIGISIIDGACKPLPEPLEVEKGLCKPVDTSAPHKVIIGSEEQFKVFSLPNLKPLCKLKLTASEGARVRRMAISSFTTRHHSEHCLLCLTNLGDLIVLSVPELRRQLYAAVIRREDITGISSLTLTRHGEALYLHSSSEFQRVTVSASRVTSPNCYLKLPSSARPKLNSVSTTSEGDDVTLQEERSVNEDNKRNSGISNSISGKLVEIKQNGISSGDEEGNNSTINTTIQSHMSHESSVGDITIDSVRDHIVNSMSEEFRTVTTEVKHQVEKTIKHETEITKTSTVTVSETLVNNTESSTTQPALNNNTTTTTTITVEDVSDNNNISGGDDEEEDVTSESSDSGFVKNDSLCTVRKAPLANSEEFNETLI